MAINTNISPTVSGVYTQRDFTPQLNYMNENAAKAMRSAADFTLDLQNEAVKQKQKKIIEDEYNRQQTLKENISNDERLLVKLKNDLAELKAGRDVEIRSDENKSFWNFMPAEV